MVPVQRKGRYEGCAPANRPKRIRQLEEEERIRSDDVHRRKAYCGVVWTGLEGTLVYGVLHFFVAFLRGAAATGDVS